MEATYRALSESEFEQLRDDPEGAENFLWHLDLLDDGEALLRKEQEEATAGRRFTLEKDWHALHFLLTGDAGLDLPPDPSPLGKVVLGGSDTEWEASYGQVRLLSAQEVSDAAAALRSISLEDLQNRFDPTRFNEMNIYPNPRPGGWTHDRIQSLWDIYPGLVRFFEAAATERAVILVYLE